MEEGGTWEHVHPHLLITCPQLALLINYGNLHVSLVPPRDPDIHTELARQGSLSHHGSDISLSSPGGLEFAVRAVERLSQS
jgi:hypothetical protein